MSADGFSFLSDSLVKAVKLPWFAVLSCLAMLGRRDKNLWVFSRRSGVGDGPLSLALKVRTSNPEVRIVWLTQNLRDDQLAAAQQLEFVRRDSWKALRICLRAGVGVMTNGFSDLRGPAIWGAVVVQLWHGAPLKRIGRDRVGHGGRSPGLLRAMIDRFEVFWNSHYTYVIAGSPLAADRLASAMSLAPEKVVVAGDPRMDLLGQGAPESRRMLEALAQRSGLGGRSFFAIIAPTWRDGGEASVNADEKTRLLVAARSDLVIFFRAHPHSAEMEVLADMSNVIALPPDVFPDVTSLLAGFDMLLTDYSSIAMDFSVLGRPIILVAPDLNAYVTSPGLYEDYCDFSANMNFTSWTDGLMELYALCAGNSPLADKYAGLSRGMAVRYHPFGSEGNAARVASLVLDRRKRK
ncbi:hypothetical protein ABB26_09820 [Stenotrophomonas humi]|uniref:Glycosyl/glycerophosphate transferase n=1 Tax=Stenotrophomonas humi TaxID=405444 RepID=A0A0R0C3S9_9GAMM|nr:CDP-glycerol glycerophosphotransferase family protein [Stenotrophomonas humi]KRG63878.1 hypothetical protein ABB26_09820 [Stenotrophomonas humi]